MHFQNFKTAALACIIAVSTAKVIDVDVGEDGFTYSPNTITADAGDSVEFQFYAPHSVIAADFSKPCNPASSGGFFSGIMSNKNIWSIVINNTEPIFFYCGVDGHCQGGMVGVINQGTDTLDAFKAAAEKTDSSVSPKAPFGGFKGPAPNSTSSSGSGSSTASSTAESSISASSTSGTQAQSPTSSSPSAGTMSAAAAYLDGSAAAVGGLAVAVAALIGL